MGREQVRQEVQQQQLLLPARQPRSLLCRPQDCQQARQRERQHRRPQRQAHFCHQPQGHRVQRERPHLRRSEGCSLPPGFLNTKVTIFDKSNASIFSLPIVIIFCEGSTPRILARTSVGATNSYCFAKRIAKSAVPVAKSKICIFSFCLLKISPFEVTSLTNVLLQPVSKLSDKTRLIKS